MGKKKKAAVKYEWCYCCKDVMPTDNEGRCTVCFSYIILN